MDNKQVASRLIRMAKELIADIRLSPKDKKIIEAFTDKKSMDNNKFESDGKVLDGLWMGGKKIAYWKGGKISFGPNASRSIQTVQKYVRKIAPSSWFANQ